MNNNRNKNQGFNRPDCTTYAELRPPKVLGAVNGAEQSSFLTAYNALNETTFISNAASRLSLDNSINDSVNTTLLGFDILTKDRIEREERELPVLAEFSVVEVGQAKVIRYTRSSNITKTTETAIEIKVKNSKFYLF